MSKCPFATWKPISGSSGSYTGGPFRIVHHTTEGSTAEGAFGAFRQHHSDPHFTVGKCQDGKRRTFQHIDTSVAARALRHNGEPQTNRLSAIQIEVVGFAGKAKDVETLGLVAKLCRWIENEHDVEQEWPSGYPTQDANDCNRDVANWRTKSGHYGHCNVPQNTHWDPGYTEKEVYVVMGWDWTPDSEKESA